MFFYSNMSLYYEHGYFSAIHQAKALLHLWSLGVEEQFYLLWPGVLVLLSRFRVPVLKITFLFILISFGASVVLSIKLPVSAFYLLPTRIWEILLGAVLATRELKLHEGSYGQFKSVVGFVLLIFAGFFIRDTNGFPGAWALLPCVGAALLISAGNTAWLNQKILSSRLLVFLGMVSYSFYLWQWPVLVFGGFYFHTDLWIYPLILLCLSLIIATLSTYLLELPLRNKFRSTEDRESLIRFFIVILFTYGLLWGFSNQMVRKFGYWGPNKVFKQYEEDFRNFPSTDFVCQKQVDPHEQLDICKTTSGVNPPDILLFGDSHAKSLFPGLSELYQKSGKTLMVLGTWACPPFADRSFVHSWDTKRCLDSVHLITEYILKSPSVKTVLLSFVFSDLKGWKKSAPRGDVNKIAIEKLNHFSKLLIENGRKVVLMGDVPDFNFMPRDCFQPPWSPNTPLSARCPINQEKMKIDAEARMKFYNGVSVSCLFQSGDVFSKNGIYSVVENGHFLFWDATHVNVRGSKIIASEFEKSPCF